MVKTDAIKVTSYSGYKAEQEPRFLEIGGRKYEVRAIEKTWCEEGFDRRRKRYFLVKADDGNLYRIYYDEEMQEWFLEWK